MSAPPDVLVEIVARRRDRLSDGWHGVSLAEDPIPEVRENPFVRALRSREGRAVIAEVKMGSPKLGDLRGRVDPERQARLYAENGAAALSVVVEPDFFHGSYDLLRRCREASGLPALAKDFLVDDRQLVWAREAGASAVLLVASILGREELNRYARKARGLGLVPLVETHDAEDLAKLEGARWELVGVNNRDLRTFEVDLEHSARMASRLPSGSLKVAESGIGSAEDVARLREAGFGAFLVGESLLLAEEPVAQLQELLR